MSTNSTMINDRYCLNCSLSEYDCNSPVKDDPYAYCIDWTPTKTDRYNIENFQLDESMPDDDQ